MSRDRVSFPALGPSVLLAVLGLVALLAPVINASGDEPQEAAQSRRVIVHVGSGAEAAATGHAVTHVFIDENGVRHEVEGEDLHWEGEGPGWALHQALGGGGFLGVGLTPLTSELQAHFGVPEGTGVLISKIVENSPAAAAGVQVGDILTRFEGEAVGSARELTRAVASRKAGDSVTFEVWRDGQPLELTATLGEAEGRQVAKKIYAVKIACEKGDEGCGAGAAHVFADAFDCGGAEDCRVEVTCHDGDCTCVVNGETADCAMLHHGH